MATKIIEKIIEPSKIYVGSTFKLKIRIDRQKYTLGDLKKVKCSYLKTLTCREINEGG